MVCVRRLRVCGCAGVLVWTGAETAENGERELGVRKLDKPWLAWLVQRQVLSGSTLPRDA